MKLKPYKILSKWGDFHAGDISKPQLREMCSELAEKVSPYDAERFWKDITEFQRYNRYA